MKCPKCNGDGELICSACHGVGIIPEPFGCNIIPLGFPMIRNNPCYKCNGSLKEKCTLCGGTGEIPDSED